MVCSARAFKEDDSLSACKYYLFSLVPGLVSKLEACLSCSSLCQCLSLCVPLSLCPSVCLSVSLSLSLSLTPTLKKSFFHVESGLGLQIQFRKVWVTALGIVRKLSYSEFLIPSFSYAGGYILGCLLGLTRNGKL